MRNNIQSHGLEAAGFEVLNLKPGSTAKMGSNGDLNANSQCLSSTGDLVLDKAISQWMTWDKVRMQLVFNIITLTL